MADATDDMPEEIQAALSSCFSNLVDVLGQCKRLLESWCHKGENALGVVKRFLGSGFYELQLKDVSSRVLGFRSAQS